MKTIFFNRFLMTSAVLLVMLAGCKKNIPMATLTPGTTQLTASNSTLVLDSTGAASKTAVILSWPAVNFGAQVSVTYTLQIDSVNGNFAKPTSINMNGSTSKSFTVADLNTLALTLGLAPAAAGQLTTRVVANVNQSTGASSTVAPVMSNVLNLTVTPYSTTIPPLYPVPPNLYIIGGALPLGTVHGWDNPVPVPVQQFTQIDATTFGIVVNLTGGQQFLLLPVNGDWSHKYACTAHSADPTNGPFVPDADSNINAPATSGLYRITVDFIKGTYEITPASPGDIPTSLFIVGDATAGAWNVPVPVPSQQFTQISNGEFTLTLPMLATGSYLFLPHNDNSYNPKYGGTSATGGTLLENGSEPGSNTPGPGAAGTYTIDVNFFSNTYSVK